VSATIGNRHLADADYDPEKMPIRERVQSTIGISQMPIGCRFGIPIFGADSGHVPSAIGI